jgi:2-polyprenyl-3-methyl-5-hydroxy-6-metoxy-1,4-benzoquinol methylase
MSKIAEKESMVFEKYINYISNFIKLDQKKILDIGCGTGNFIKTLQIIKKNNEIYALDHNEKAVRSLKESNYNVKYFDLNCDNSIPFNQKFDIITMFDVIEHLNSFVSFDKIIDENLSDNGFIVITTPNSNSLQRYINQSGYTGEFDPTHRILYTPYTLDFFLRRRGLTKVINYTPYIFSFKKNIFNQYFMYGGQIFTIYKKQ